jgi:hypothetical protein
MQQRGVFEARTMLDAYTAWVVAITGGLSTLGTLACTKGVDALLRIRKAKADEVMEDKKYEDSQESVAFQQATAAYDKLIAAFESRVNTLETAITTVNGKLEESSKREVACMVEQERLRGDLKALQVHVDRLWKHDQVNQANVSGLKKQLEEETAAKGAGPQ